LQSSKFSSFLLQSANTVFIPKHTDKQGGNVMTDKAKIKVVKRVDVPDVKRKRKTKRQRTTPRQIVNNVTEWVADLKQRKSEETKAAFDVLFASRPEPSEL